MVLGCGITPANRPEAEAMPAILRDLEHYDRSELGELHVDRGYMAADETSAIAAVGADVVSKPWPRRTTGRFTKDHFRIDVRRRTVTCPAGQTRPFQLGRVTEFDPAQCAACAMRDWCTESSSGRGRTLSIAEDELLQIHLRKQQATTSGRERLRERVAVEHRLAHHAQKQGVRARYLGVRKNLFDARRCAAVVNLENIQHRIAKAA